MSGATRGIGRAVADLLAHEGCHVALGARDPAQVAAAAEQLRGDGCQAYGERVDAADHACSFGLGWPTPVVISLRRLSVR